MSKTVYINKEIQISNIYAIKAKLKIYIDC